MNITRLDIDTFFADRFMPPRADTVMYFGHTFIPPYHQDYYAPTVPDTYYGIPALGGLAQATPAPGIDVFRSLSAVGVGLATAMLSQGELKKKLDAEKDIARIKAAAEVAIARERAQAASAPLVVSGGLSGPSPVVILSGALVLLAAGGTMYFLTREEK